MTGTSYEFASMQASVLGYLQGPQDTAVTLETAPVLEVPTVRITIPSAHASHRQSLSGRSACRSAALLCKFHDLMQALQRTEKESGLDRLLDEHPIASICRCVGHAPRTKEHLK